MYKLFDEQDKIEEIKVGISEDKGEGFSFTMKRKKDTKKEISEDA